MRCRVGITGTIGDHTRRGHTMTVKAAPASKPASMPKAAPALEPMPAPELIEKVENAAPEGAPGGNAHEVRDTVTPQPAIHVEERRLSLNDFLKTVVKIGGSDLHLQGLSVPMIRVDG